MTCPHCGVAMENQSHGSISLYVHPGGQCPKQVFVWGGEDFTHEEVLALKRVARAQLEMETKRGGRGE